MANVETTSLAVLALDGMTEPRGGGSDIGDNRAWS
jgi:hypothetical protein